MNTTQEQLIGWAREIDAQLAIPEHPEDLSTPVDFGTCGVVVMSDNAPMLVATGEDFSDLLEDDGVKLFAQGFGSFFLVSYGGVIESDAETGESSPHIARVVMGMTYDGVTTALMRFLDNETVQVADNDSTASGDLYEAMLRVFA